MDCEICCQKFGGNGSLCIVGVVQDWYSLIGSLVIWCGYLTCVFVANSLYVAFIYTYVSLACSYVVFIYLYVSHTCLHIMCVFCLLSATRLHVGDSSRCSMVCCCYYNPTSAPIGNPSMVRLSWDCRSMLFLVCMQFLILCTI